MGETIAEIFPWNVPYWSERQRKELYGFNGEDLRPYFQVGHVLDGLFSITSTIFGIRVGAAPDVKVYHPDVRLFKVFDAATGRHLGSSYADLYPRDGKRTDAWTGDLEYGYPHIVVLGANLQKVLLDHDEVATIFHEFGHVCHLILSAPPYESLSSMVAPYDFAQLPSQLLENWVWERSALDFFAWKVETSELIPDDLFAKMVRARSYENGRAYMVQLRYGKFDLELHLNCETHKGRNIDELDRELLVKYRLPSSIIVPSQMRDFCHSFSTPVGCASGYYSYLWAEVLDADVFTLFQKEGVLNADVGMRLRKEIYEAGNGKPADEIFRAVIGGIQT
jgi:oligopeptidase A